MSLKSEQGALQKGRIFDSRNRDEVRSVFVDRYGATAFDVVKTEKSFRGVGSLIRLTDVDLGYLYFSEVVQAASPSADLYRQQFSLFGRGHTKIGTGQFCVDAMSTGVVPFDADAKYFLGKGQIQLTLRVREKALRRKLAALIGRPVNRKIDFVIAQSFESPKQRRLRRLIRAFVDEMDEDQGPSDFVSSEFAELLVVKFLTAHQHNYSHFIDGTATAASSKSLRLVEDFIEANWDKPLTIEGLAQQTGVGARNIFATFRKERGYSPMSFLLNVRLRHAREMLQFPSEATSVLAVSLKCGFRNAGHFARYYREVYGELPSVTLAIARRK